MRAVHFVVGAAVRSSALLVAALLALGVLAPLAAGAGLLAVAVGSWLLVRALRRRGGAPALGPADAVTLVRLVLVGVVVALVADPYVGGTSHGSAVAAVALTAIVLDGVDGRVARATGTASELGARFDMETDALLILVLALLAWRWQRADAWVLASGMMRYAFVLAARPWPWLGGDLAPSRRRQAICVVQVVALVAVLAPWWPAGVAPALAALALGLLCYSFGVDVLELARRRRSTEGVTA